MGIRKDGKLQLLLWDRGIRSDTIFLFVGLAENEYFSTECSETCHSWACSDPLRIIALSMEQFYYVKWSNLMFWKLVVDFEGNNGAKWQGFMHDFHSCSLSCLCLWHSDMNSEYLLLVGFALTLLFHEPFARSMQQRQPKKNSRFQVFPKQSRVRKHLHTPFCACLRSRIWKMKAVVFRSIFCCHAILGCTTDAQRMLVLM